MAATVMPDGTRRADPIWNKALHKGENPPQGVWLTVQAKKSFQLSPSLVFCLAILAGLFVSSASLVRPNSWLLFSLLGIATAGMTFLALWLYGRPEEGPAGESHLLIAPRGPDKADAQATVARAVAGLGWGVVEERPLDVPHSSLRGRVWQFDSSISLHYAVGGEEPQHILVASAKDGKDADRFVLLKGVILAGLEGEPADPFPGAATVIARETPTAPRPKDLPRDATIQRLVNPPLWATTPRPFPELPLPDAPAPARKPEALPVGWWASTTRGRDIHGRLRLNPRWVGAMAGLFLAGMLPFAALSTRPGALIPLTLANYAVAVLVLSPPSILSMIWFARRTLGEHAVCFLRIRGAKPLFEGLCQAVTDGLTNHFPEVGPSSMSNPLGVEWADIENKTFVFLWRSKAGGDPLLEVRSTAPANKVVAFKGTVASLLFGGE